MTKQFNQKTRARGIEWCDETLNRTGGCHHDCRWEMPDGTIAICYAETIANGVARRAYRNGFKHHYWRPPKKGGRLTDVAGSRLIFIDSMSDLFGHWVPDNHIRAVLDEVRAAPQHFAQVLTKNAPRILQYVDDLPENLWVGVSSPPDFVRGNRLKHRQQWNMLANQLSVLHDVRVRRPEIVTWMSIEPLSWDISPLLASNCPLHWAVIGAATNGRKKYQPDASHVASTLRVLDHSDVPVFFKGNLKWSPWREDFPPINHPALRQRQQNAAKYGWTPNRFAPNATPTP